MEILFSETIHKTKHYVFFNEIEYLREYDYTDLPSSVSWIKQENGKSELVEDYAELELIFKELYY